MLPNDLQTRTQKTGRGTYDLLLLYILYIFVMSISKQNTIIK